MILTAPVGPEGKFIMVNMTTLRAHVEDTSCILKPGDHPSINHDSVVYFLDAREWWINGDRGYDSLLAKGIIIPRQKLDDPILRRVQEGALNSVFFKKKFRVFVEDSLV